MRNFFNKAINNPVGISLISLFIVLIFSRLWFYYILLKDSSYVLNIWAASYQLIALYGGVFGLIVSSRWGGTKTNIGKAIIAFSIGLLLQCFGQSVYSYYFNIDIPYPSLGDVGYFGSYLSYAYGAFTLTKILKEKIPIKFVANNIYIILIPLIILITSFFILLQAYSFDWTNLTKIFLDFATPLVDATSIYFSLLAFSFLNQKLKGAIKKPLLCLIFALVFEYLGDYLFIYQANNGTYSGGNLVDLIMLIAYILMTLTLILLSIWPKLISE